MFIWYLIPRIRGESFPESVVPNFQNRWGVISRIRGESFQDFAAGSYASSRLARRATIRMRAGEYYHNIQTCTRVATARRLERNAASLSVRA